MAEENSEGLEGLDDFGDDFGDQLDSFMEGEEEEEAEEGLSFFERYAGDTARRRYRRQRAPMAKAEAEEAGGRWCAENAWADVHQFQ